MTKLLRRDAGLTQTIKETQTKPDAHRQPYKQTQTRIDININTKITTDKKDTHRNTDIHTDTQTKSRYI